MGACHNHRACKEDALADAQAICKQAGARFTKARQAVFEVIWGAHKALTAPEVMEKIGNSQPPITYRALDFLKQHGLIHHVASLNAYVGCVHAADNGHIGQLMVCTNCRLVLEAEPQEAIRELAKIARQKNFKVFQTHIEMLGFCAACVAEGAH